MKFLLIDTKLCVTLKDNYVSTLQMMSIIVIFVR